MVDKTKDNSLDSEIAKRLDDLFGEEDAASDDDSPIESDDKGLAENMPQKEEQPAAEAEILELKEVTANRANGGRVPDDYPLAELKNLVLSIDWEITEEALAGLLVEIESLKNTYKNEKIILMFFQLLASLGQYIKTNRGNAHLMVKSLELREVGRTDSIFETDQFVYALAAPTPSSKPASA